MLAKRGVQRRGLRPEEDDVLDGGQPRKVRRASVSRDQYIGQI